MRKGAAVSDRALWQTVRSEPRTSIYRTRLLEKLGNPAEHTPHRAGKRRVTVHVDPCRTENRPADKEITTHNFAPYLCWPKRRPEKNPRNRSFGMVRKDNPF